MDLENSTILTNYFSENPFTILDLLSLFQRTQDFQEDNENTRHLNLAASALLHLAEKTDIANSDEPVDTAITDLLTDIMNLCAHLWPDDSSVSFESVMGTVRMHFLAESAELTQWD